MKKLFLFFRNRNKVPTYKRENRNIEILDRKKKGQSRKTIIWICCLYEENYRLTFKKEDKLCWENEKVGKQKSRVVRLDLLSAALPPRHLRHAPQS